MTRGGGTAARSAKCGRGKVGVVIFPRMPVWRGAVTEAREDEERDELVHEAQLLMEAESCMDDVGETRTQIAEKVVETKIPRVRESNKAPLSRITAPSLPSFVSSRPIVLVLVSETM
jgi:hypothetical protein